jgi:spore maturation protein CgeB
MKMLYISTFYPQYWKSFYSQRPSLVKQEYKVQHETLIYDCFGWSDFWSHACHPLGYEVKEIFANVKPLQLRWAREKGIKPAKNWLLDIVFKQIRNYDPDILFMDDYLTFPYTWLEEVKKNFSSIKLVIGWCGAPFQDANVFKAYDIVLSCIPELVTQFRDMGHHSEHLNHAFDPRILERISITNNPQLDFLFIGQISCGEQYHLQREKILESLVQKIPIQIYSPNASFTWKDKLKALTKLSFYSATRTAKKIGVPDNWLTSIPAIGRYAAFSERSLYLKNPLLQSFIQAPIFGLEMFQALKNSKIAFNNHIDISSHSASNMRLFEVTGVGTCLVTDWKENLHTIFTPDTEVITYRSTDECVEKVQWLLANPQKQAEIATAGQKRTLKNHTFQHRAVKLNELIVKGLEK